MVRAARSARDLREKDPKEKSELGLVDLHDPYTRATKCAGCHIGNKAEGKFVTHEMYAAGHPPLPPFELVTYCRDMPRHYHTYRDTPGISHNRFLTEMASKDPDKAWKTFHFRLPKDECPNARDFALGTVAAFESTMKLLADDARETPKGQLLDFAHFDCYACHHDLKVPSWRQERGYRGVPGRPTMRPWATESLQAILEHAQAANGKLDTESAAKIANEFGASLKALECCIQCSAIRRPTASR